MSKNITMGIYKITNLIDGKFYIGSSNNIKERWKQHKRLLDKGKHHSYLLQEAWDECGKDSFDFKVIEVVNNEKDLLDIEQKWLDETKCYNKDIGYNISKNTKYNEIGESFLDSILKTEIKEEKINVMYNDNLCLINSDKEKKKITFKEPIKVLDDLIFDLYEYYKKIIDLNYLKSDCIMYSDFFNFDINNIAQFDVYELKRLLKIFNIDMVSITYNGYETEYIDIYRNNLFGYVITKDILCVQTKYKTYSICLSDDSIPVYKNMDYSKLISQTMTK